MSADLVSLLLSPYRGNSSNYGSGESPLSDHLPMALTALVAMGATEERAVEWARSYSERLRLRSTAVHEERGRRKWREQIQRDGASATLQHVARTLADGLGAAAFHSVIRASYALLRGDDEELSAAFESWKREYLQLPTPLDAPRVDVGQALSALAKSNIQSKAQGLIATRMRIVGASDEFVSIVSSVPRASDVDELAIAAARAFYLSCDFTALHVMTATHALRVLKPHLVDADAIMPAFWTAFSAAAIVSGALPTLDERLSDGLRRPTPAEWRATLAKAFNNDDEHVIKATYTAWRLDLEIGNPIFHAAAERYIERQPATS